MFFLVSVCPGTYCGSSGCEFVWGNSEQSGFFPARRKLPFARVWFGGEESKCSGLIGCAFVCSCSFVLIKKKNTIGASWTENVIMEFYVYFVIVVVILISLATSLIISKLPRGKTFDEVLSEKKKLAEKLYGTTGKKSQKTKKQPPNAGKKGKEKAKKEVESPAEDSVDTSTEKPPSPKAHVEFAEAEVITDTDSPRAKVRGEGCGSVAGGPKMDKMANCWHFGRNNWV